MAREFNEEHTPLAYFITFRCYGTWLHGDERGSVDRFNNRYGAPLIPPDKRWLKHNQNSLTREPVKLSTAQRAEVHTAISETCEKRRWLLHAANVRTNHVHVVVSATCGPARILSALKANGTRRMREAGYWQDKDTPWADGGSKRYLWTERHVQKAIDYVELAQGDEFP
jgi:REP element-mobilizing transposase RayT